MYDAVIFIFIRIIILKMMTCISHLFCFSGFWQQYLLWGKTGAQSEIEPWITAQVTFIPNNHFQVSMFL